MTVFREGGIAKLDFEYVPPHLPHREEYVSQILGFLKKVMVDEPGSTSGRVLIVGRSGTGKTVTARRVGEELLRVSSKGGVDVRCVHVNCRMVGSEFALIQSILRASAPELPLRGYSPLELLNALRDYLEDGDRYLLIVLDELDYFVRVRGEDLLYEFTRVMDAKPGRQRMSFIFIARSEQFIDELSPATLSRFRPQLRFRFKPYKAEELFDILSERVEEAFVDGAVSEEVVRFVAKNAAEFGYGDARYAIQLLLVAGLAADRDGSREVLPEHVREAQEATDPRVREEDILTLSRDGKALLLALARTLMDRRDAAYVPLGEVLETYVLVCEEYGFRPVEKPVLRQLLRELELTGLISYGEAGSVGIPGVKVGVLEKVVSSILGGGGPAGQGGLG